MWCVDMSAVSANTKTCHVVSTTCRRHIANIFSRHALSFCPTRSTSATMSTFSTYASIPEYVLSGTCSTEFLHLGSLLEARTLKNTTSDQLLIRRQHRLINRIKCCRQLNAINRWTALIYPQHRSIDAVDGGVFDYLKHCLVFLLF